MTYESFKETLLAELAGYFPQDTLITIHNIPKNNHTFLDGLTILESGFNIAPTIYIHQYYEHIRQGTPFLTVFQQILDTYYEYRPKENIDTSLFEDFKKIQHQIVFKLINYERNKELLNHIPHIPFLDLAIVFYCLLTNNPSGTATILIQNEHLKLWGTDTQAIYQLARQNSPFLLSPHFQRLSSLLNTMMPYPSDILWDDSTFPLYILTNESRFLGAACLLYDELLQEISCKMNSDFYIIPSSIHEVLLIPDSINMNQQDFNEMIQEVNETQLAPEDILSNHVYFYSREKNKITA